MSRWLFKQEPSCYSVADLERDGTTLWDGVSNALARKNLRQTKPGDRVFFYHTGKEKAIVGEMKVVDEPTADPKSDDPRSVVVKVKLVRRFRNIQCRSRRSRPTKCWPNGTWCVCRAYRSCPFPTNSGRESWK